MQFKTVGLIEVTLTAVLPGDLAKEIEAQQKRTGLNDSEWIAAAAHTFEVYLQRQANASKARVVANNNKKKKTGKRRGHYKKKEQAANERT